MLPAARSVRYLWVAPATLLGLIAALASFSIPHRSGGVALCRTDRGFARWFLLKRGYSAITLGHVVLVTSAASPDILSHELVHVRQVEKWGPLFLPAYLGAMVLVRLRGGNPYWDNPFEVEAREAAGQSAR